MKVNTFNHLTTFIASSKSLYKNLVIWNFLFLQFGKFRPFFGPNSLAYIKMPFFKALKWKKLGRNTTSTMVNMIGSTKNKVSCDRWIIVFPFLGL
jgi:hypothetical protein